MVGRPEEPTQTRTQTTERPVVPGIPARDLPGWVRAGLKVGAGCSAASRLLFLPAVRRVPPRFSIPPTNHEVMPGGSVNLTCIAVGAPMPYVKWISGDLELTREDEVPIGRNVLELTNIRQSANYTCVAASSLGVIQTTAQICVKGQPPGLGAPLLPALTLADSSNAAVVAVV